MSSLLEQQRHAACDQRYRHHAEAGAAADRVRQHQHGAKKIATANGELVYYGRLTYGESLSTMQLNISRRVAEALTAPTIQIQPQSMDLSCAYL